MFLIFDTETTGLPKDFSAPVSDTNNWPRCIQLAWQLHDFSGKLIDIKNYIIKPDGFSIPYNSEKIHGISTKRAQLEGHSVDFVLQEFLAALNQSSYLVGHNISFDINIIFSEYYRISQFFSIEKLERRKLILRRDEKIWKTLDTMSEKSASFCQISGGRFGKFKFPKLTELYYKLFGNEFSEAHNASVDVAATARCFFELIRLKIINTDGVFSNEQKKDNRINQFNFYGSLNTLKSSNILEIKGSAKDLPLSFIKALWPENLGKGARAWTNRSLFNGIISDLEFNSKFVFKKDGRLLFDPVINLDFDFNDIEVHYLKNMPPMTDTLGKAHLDFQMFNINLLDGRIDLEEGSRIYINNGKFNAFDIKKRHGPGQIIIDSSSNVGDFFNLLSKHNYISKLIKLGRNNLSGESNLMLQFDFPLKNSIKFSETKTNINLNIEEITIYNKEKKPSIISDSSTLILDYNIDEASFFKGTIETKSLKILELPIFAQILDVSIPGLSNISDGGRDITFASSTFNVQLSNKGINIIDGILKPESNLPVVGNSLGLSLAGMYIFGINEIEFNGTVVPVSWLNNLPSNVPILGELFSGSKDGEGLIGIKFRIYNEDGGKVIIETNPLSVLTPGFLQRVFD